MKKLAFLAEMPSAVTKGWAALSTVAAISIMLPCSLAGIAHAQPDAQSSEKTCLSLLNLGATADVVEYICKIKTGGSRGVVANYNQGGCKNILPEDVVKRRMAAITHAVMAKEKSEGRSKFCANSAQWDRSLNNNDAPE